VWSPPTAAPCGITVRDNQVRLILPPQAARAVGPPRTRTGRWINHAKRTTQRVRSTPPEGGHRPTWRSLVSRLLGCSLKRAGARRRFPGIGAIVPAESGGAAAPFQEAARYERLLFSRHATGADLLIHLGVWRQVLAPTSQTARQFKQPCWLRLLAQRLVVQQDDH
jgi:hypothetical protein